MRRLMIVILILVCIPRVLWAQRLFMKNYTMNEGLPAAQIFCAFQDQRGYMWFGSPGGLARYDGANFKVFTVDDGLLHDSVRDVISYREHLWFAGEKGVTRFDGVRFKGYTTDDGLGQGIVWKGVVHQDQLWLSTSTGGLSRLEGDRFVSYTTEDGLPSNNVFALLSDGKYLWIGTRGGGLTRYDGEHFENFGAEKGLPARHITAMIRTDSVLWIGTRDAGIFSYQQGRFRQVIDQVKIYSAARRGNQIFWGTLGQGVIRMDLDGRNRTYDTNNGLAGDRVYSVLVDRENSVWFTTNSGVSKLLSDKFISYFPEKNILAVAEYRGNIWLGTLGEGLWRLEHDRWTSFTDKDGLWNNTVWSLAVHDHQLWIGTSDGLNSFDGRRLVRREMIDSPSFGAIYHMLPDGQVLWISTNGGLCAYRDQRCETYLARDGLASNTTYQGTRYRDKVCFATEGGVSCIKDGKVTNYGTQHGLPSSTVYSILYSHDQVLWVGTNRGIGRLEGESFVGYGKQHGLSNNQIVALAEYQDQILVGTNWGLNIFSNGRVQTLYEQKTGLCGNEINFSALFVDQPESVWVGTTTGVTRYFPALDVPNQVEPPVWIENCLVNGSPFQDCSGKRLRHDQNSLSFEYSGLSFKDEENVVYRYRLAGYEDKWSQPTRTRQVRYTNLSNGRYTFQVEARNGDGLWSSAPAAQTFEILPPYWKTWWFRSLLALLVGGVLYAGHRLRLRQIGRRNTELERIVQDRTQQLLKANEELKELSLTDPLTRLHNRRYLRETVELDIRRFHQARRVGERRNLTVDLLSSSLGFLMIDIDHFKQVNDQYGHEAGDSILVELSGQILQFVRDVDSVVRWGGEEFLVVCKDVDRNAIRDVAQRVADGLKHYHYKLGDGSRIQKTCSIGFSLYPFSLGNTVLFNYEEVINISDQALYVAKQNGRDMVVGIVEGDREISSEIKPRIKNDLAMAIDNGYFKLLAPKQNLKLN